MKVRIKPISRRSYEKLALLLLLPSTLYLTCCQQTSLHREELVREMAKKLVSETGVPPGISIAIMQHGKTVFEEGFGYADLESKERVTTKTQFRAASVSKIITVTALAKLTQEDLLDIDRPIQKYLPGYPQKKYPITARQLAGHLSGISHYSSSDSIQKRFYNSVSESLSVFSHIELLNEPGTVYNYSTHGYTLLSAIIERASQQTFLDYVKSTLFDHLEMHNTGPDMRSDVSQNMTVLYGLNEKGLPERIEHPEDPSYKWGGGGMISTPSDLVKLGNAYLNGFIKPEMVDQAFESQKLRSGEETGVGLGWRRSWDMDGRVIFEHAGAMGGARSVLSIYPNNGLVIAIMANTYRPRNIEETAHMLALPFLKEATPKVQPNGKWNIELTITSPEAEDIQVSGFLILNGKTDRIVIRPNGPEMTTYPLIYLQRNNVYALFHPNGLLHAEINSQKNMLFGRCVRYRSPRNQLPFNDKSYLSFRTKF